MLSTLLNLLTVPTLAQVFRLSGSLFLAQVSDLLRPCYLLAYFIRF